MLNINEDPVLLIGDFNAEENSKVIDYPINKLILNRIFNLF